jgi:hypothetical protein
LPVNPAEYIASTFNIQYMKRVRTAVKALGHDIAPRVPITGCCPPPPHLSLGAAHAKAGKNPLNK